MFFLRVQNYDFPDQSREAWKQPAAKEKPRYIMKNLEDFLVPGALGVLNETIEQKKQECAALAAKAQVPKGGKNKKDPAMKKAKQAKKELAELSQQLVLKLVKMIEEKEMLKPALSLHRTHGTENDKPEDGSTGVPDVVTCLLKEFICDNHQI